MSEAKHQEALIEWWDRSYSILRHLLFAIPNGGFRNAREASSLKRQGVRPGVPDLFLAAPRGTYHGLFIEMKFGKNKLSIHQEKYLKNLECLGYKTAVCYRWDKAREVIEEYLNGRS